MITSKQILEATGLKNAKTLTRWYQGGLIPEPLVRTHPSGRGKIAYWPDWVLERCKRIVALQQQGHTLRSALMQIELERMGRLLEEVKARPLYSELLHQKKMRLPNGGETDLLSLLNMIISKEANNVLAGEEDRNKLAQAVQAAKAAGGALELLVAGYNPVCIFNGTDAEITPDFLVGQIISEHSPSAPAWIVIPLLAPLRKAFAALGLTPPPKPRAEPAPKIWIDEGGALVEYSVLIIGSKGFELIRETGKVLGSSAPEGSEDGDGA